MPPCSGTVSAIFTNNIIEDNEFIGKNAALILGDS